MVHGLKSGTLGADGTGAVHTLGTEDMLSDVMEDRRDSIPYSWEPQLELSFNITDCDHGFGLQLGEILHITNFYLPTLVCTVQF